MVGGEDFGQDFDSAGTVRRALDPGEYSDSEVRS
jgi:hypothetical protein